MVFFIPCFRRLASLLVALVALSFGLPAWAQEESPHEPLEIARILSPPLEGEVAPLDCLILIKIDEYYVGDDYYYLILLDDEAVTARWDPDALTFSYYPDRMLSAGGHTIKVYMSQTDGVRNHLAAQGTFTVAGAARPPERPAPETLFDLGAEREPPPPPPSPVRRTETADFFSVRGRLNMNAAFVSLTGLGRGLRQEPENTSIFDLNGRGRYGATSFDLRFYITSDESEFEQPRNRYAAHVENPNYGLYIGDATPRFDPLLIDGLRVRGVYGWGTLGPVTLRFAEGETRRETRSQYDEDSRIRRRGQGERRLWCARLAVWEDGPLTLGFNYLTGDEESPDIENTGNPGNNTVRSLDFLWRFDQGNGSLRGGWAESKYDYDDSEKEDAGDVQAQELEAIYAVGGHSLKARWQLVEPGFVSLGRSSLQKDRETFGLEDRINLGRGALTGRIYWEQYSNNVNDTLDFTTTSSRYGGQVRYRFGRTGPNLQFNYQMQERLNNAEEGQSGRTDEANESYGVGITHTFDFWGARSNLRADWRASQRGNKINPDYDSTQDTITINLTSRWSSGFQLDLLYGNTDSAYPGRDRFTDVDRFSVRASYTPRDRRIVLWGRWEGVQSEGSQATYNSDRDTVELGMRWSLGLDLVLEASLTLVDFDDHDNDANDFGENTFRLILMQMIS